MPARNSPLKSIKPHATVNIIRTLRFSADQPPQHRELSVSLARRFIVQLICHLRALSTRVTQTAAHNFLFIMKNDGAIFYVPCSIGNSRFYDSLAYWLLVPINFWKATRIYVFCNFGSSLDVVVQFLMKRLESHRRANNPSTEWNMSMKFDETWCYDDVDKPQSTNPSRAKEEASTIQFNSVKKKTKTSTLAARRQNEENLINFNSVESNKWLETHLGPASSRGFGSSQ